MKSAYITLQFARRRNLNDNSGFWRKLWNLKIPPKVKNFLWRSINNCLPTKDLLHIKQVHVNSTCPVCNEDAESILHSLVICPFTENCRSIAALPAITGAYQSFENWLQLVFDQGNKTSTTVSVMLCWMVWKNRNDLVWSQKCLTASEVVQSALSVLNQ